MSQCSLCFQEARGWNVGAAPKTTGNTNYRSVTVRAINMTLNMTHIHPTIQIKVRYIGGF